MVLINDDQCAIADNVLDVWLFEKKFNHSTEHHFPRVNQGQLQLFQSGLLGLLLMQIMSKLGSIDIDNNYSKVVFAVPLIVGKKIYRVTSK